jgi:hypothetical protein
MTILSSSEREEEEEEEVRCSSQLNGYTERPKPPFVEEETSFQKHVNVQERKLSVWPDPIHHVNVQHRQYLVAA